LPGSAPRRRGTLLLVVLASCAGNARAPAAGSPDPAPEVRLDAEFARLALEHVRTGDPALLEALARTPAAAHLLTHARAFDNEDVPRDSAAALVAHLLAPSPERAAGSATCARSLELFEGTMRADRSWIGDVERYLPPDRRLRATVHLTFGYDIGVAYGDQASLNCAHPRFAKDPRELLYYAVHELHHAGFMAFQPPVPFARVRTCADLLEVVRRHTQMEGMAVLSALPRRAAEGALASDGDSTALADPAEMRREEARYAELVRSLELCGEEPAGTEAWGVVERMSSERLWYRVGARMAQRIERARGRRALVELIELGADRFMQVAAQVARAPEP